MWLVVGLGEFGGHQTIRRQISSTGVGRIVLQGLQEIISVLCSTQHLGVQTCIEMNLL